MKLRFLLAAAVLLGTVSAASAQVGLYLNPIAARVSNPVEDTSVFSFLGPTSTSRTFWGIEYGAFYDFAHYSSLDVGVDLRGTDMHANNGSLKDLLVGVRVSGTPFQRSFRPYAEAAIGGGWTKSPGSAISIRKPEFRIFGGVDHPIYHHVDWRIVEVGYGTLQTISSYTVGSGGAQTIPTSSVLTVSSGFVFRFP
jgi:hypothetical protein